MVTAPRNPIRFATSLGDATDLDALVGMARMAEDRGFSTVVIADHFLMPLAPLVALQAVASATTTLRLSQTVLCQDFRHPAVLAKELATLDLLSGGRVEIGLGAGWMRAEYDQAGIRYDPASVRIARLEEYATIVGALMDGGPVTFAGEHFTLDGLELVPRPVQTPRPPILIGGGGPKLLAVAGRCADIVQVMPSIVNGRQGFDPAEVTPEAIERKVGWVRDAAGDRFAGLELGTQLVACSITDDPDAAVDALVARFAEMGQRFGGGIKAEVTRDDLLASPVVAVGPLDEVCAKLRAVRDRYGISYFTKPYGQPARDLVPVVEALAGT